MVLTLLERHTNYHNNTFLRIKLSTEDNQAASWRKEAIYEIWICSGNTINADNAVKEENAQVGKLTCYSYQKAFI